MAAEDEGGPSPKIKKELKEFASIRNIVDFEFRVRTVTTSVHASLFQEDDALVSKIDKDARGIGVIRHLASVYGNVLVDELDSESAYKLVFDRTFWRNVSALLSGRMLRRANKKQPRKLDSEDNEAVREHLTEYLGQYMPWMSESTKMLVKGVNNRSLASVMDMLVVHNKRHVKENFHQRMHNHLVCAVVMALAEHLDDAGSPDNDDLRQAAQSLYRASVEHTLVAAARFCHVLSEGPRPWGRNG